MRKLEDVGTLSSITTVAGMKLTSHCIVESRHFELHVQYDHRTVPSKGHISKCPL